MIRIDDINIVARGTYGLKEWGLEGYRSVSTAIEALLKKSALPVKRNIIIGQLTPEFTESNIYSALTIRENKFIGIGEGFFDLTDRWQKRTCEDFVALMPPDLADFARYLLTNNHCSYKLVLALVFIRDMDENGEFHLPYLKERFYNFYLSRYKKGEQVEAPNISIFRIGEIDRHKMINRICIEPLRSFFRSGFWFSIYPKNITMKENLFNQMLAGNNSDLLLITLLKAIDDYFLRISLLSTDSISNVSKSLERKKLDITIDTSNTSGDESSDTSSPSITIKKKSRGLIKL